MAWHDWPASPASTLNSGQMQVAIVLPAWASVRQGVDRSALPVALPEAILVKSHVGLENVRVLVGPFAFESESRNSGSSWSGLAPPAEVKTAGSRIVQDAPSPASANASFPGGDAVATWDGILDQSTCRRLGLLLRSRA